MNRVENQFNAQIKKFRSDNMEFINNNFAKLFLKKGIIHQQLV